MSISVQTSIQTLGDVLDFMAPYCGGSIPSETDSEYADWVRWIQNKQEEYARRAFWRRCLTRETITLNGETTLLPERFNRPNGLYMLIVDGVDWMDANNEDEQSVFVEMDNAPYTTGTTVNPNFGKWQMRFLDAPVSKSATIWYFSNPPKPVATTDKLLLPGDMIGFAALAEYFRTANQEGSQDKAEQDAENRFQEYLSLEVIPSPNELLKFTDNSKGNTKTDFLVKARDYYRTRTDRNIQ
jgi:hypothetical protein